MWGIFARNIFLAVGALFLVLPPFLLFLASAPEFLIKISSCSGVKKTYWIACSAESEVQTLALDRSNFSSRLAIRPRDLARLLSNFQSSLQELTVIATDPAAGLSNVGVDGEIEGKAVELRSYIDPTKGGISWCL